MLYETVFRSEDVAPADRFDRWRQHISRSLWPTEMVTDHVSDFRAYQRILDLGAVRLCTTEYLPMTVRWTENLIRQADPELCLMTLPLRGEVRVIRPDCETAYAAYDLAVHDSSLPTCIQTIETGDCDRDKVSEVSALVPKALLPFSWDSMDQVIARPMSGREGVGALFAGFVTRLATDTGSYRPSDGPRLGMVLIDLMSGLFAHALDGENRLVPEPHRRTLDPAHPSVHPAAPAELPTDSRCRRSRPPHLPQLPAPSLPGTGRYRLHVDSPPAPGTRPPRPRRPHVAHHPYPRHRRQLGLPTRGRLQSRVPHRLRRLSERIPA